MFRTLSKIYLLIFKFFSYDDLNIIFLKRQNFKIKVAKDEPINQICNLSFAEKLFILF